VKIYLAGKISKNDWRTSILNESRIALDESQMTAATWPIWEKAIWGQHDYVGPWFVSCDHGCAHGPNSHGLNADGLGTCMANAPRRLVASQCLSAIDRADLVFAWIDDKTAFGTLVELGYAVGIRAKTALAVPFGQDLDDLWFANVCSSAAFKAESPEIGLRGAIRRLSGRTQ
jgi:hypothetical protein